MNLLGKAIIRILENEFISHEPQLKEAFLYEISSIVNDIEKWVNSKINTQPTKEKTNEEG